jgi:hypothetical protein
MKVFEKRLRESRIEFQEHSFNRGQKHGREWAELAAEYIHLEKLARGLLEPEDIFDVAKFLDCDVEDLMGDAEPEFIDPAKFAEGFVTEALAVFAEVFPEVLDVA